MFMMFAFLAMVATGCSQQSGVTGPEGNAGTLPAADKDGTETLGTPSIAIADGSGFVEGGVGMVDVDSGVISLTVPAGATIKQVLLYWAGGTTAPAGDDQISLNGTMVQGMLIGGPTPFYGDSSGMYNFSAYRADITGLGLVSAGVNNITVADFDFPFTTVDENNGASILVIYDDGTEADLSLLDGLDMAYFGFAPTLDATVPQTFAVNAEASDRMANLVIFAGSVGIERPNQVKVTTIAGEVIIDNPLSSSDGLFWDSLTLPVLVPAGATELTVQLISTPTYSPLGASMGWIGAGLAVPVSTPLPASLGDFVWIDTNHDGVQDMGELGMPDVTVELRDCAGVLLATTVTDANGNYLFDGLMAGDYKVNFVKPEGYVFTLPDVGDDALDSDADATGAAICTTLDAGENDMTWDAGLYLPEQPGCSLTIGFWKTHAGFGPQADVVTPLLPILLGNFGGAKTLSVDTAAEAVSILTMKDYGGGKNGIAKLYAQLLGTKLNIANGAADADVAVAIVQADDFLSDHGAMDWDSLSRSEKQVVNNLMSKFDQYNNGDIGPGHCD
jgi:hypothetical protein